MFCPSDEGPEAQREEVTCRELEVEPGLELEALQAWVLAGP